MEFDGIELLETHWMPFILACRSIVASGKRSHDDKSRNFPRNLFRLLVKLCQVAACFPELSRKLTASFRRGGEGGEWPWAYFYSKQTCRRVTRREIFSLGRKGFEISNAKQRRPAFERVVDCCSLTLNKVSLEAGES